MFLIDALRTLWRTVRRRRDERELDEEIRFHLDMKSKELESTGLSPGEAKLAARRAFGNPLAVRDTTRETWCAVWLESLWLDLRIALRSMGRRPLFSGVLIATLAVGIGANTAVFGLLRPLLLEVPPVREPQSVYVLGTRIGGGAMGTNSRDTTFLSYGFFQDLRRRVDGGETGLSSLAAWASFPNRVYWKGADGALIAVEGRLVSDNFFDTLGLEPAVGSFFLPSDGDGDAPSHVVISHAFWRRHFGGAVDAIGQTLILNGHPFWVSGVSPPGFRGIAVGDDTEAWFALRHQPAVMGQIGHQPAWIDNRDIQWLRSVGRLAPDTHPDTARASLETVFLQLVRDDAGTETLSEAQQELLASHPVAIVPLREAFSMLRFEFQRPLTLLMAVVMVVLLVACANVGNLLLLRNTARHRELAARLALGAGYARLVRQVLTECLLFSLFGAGAGLTLAALVRRSLVAFIMEGRDHVFLDAATDWPLLAFTLLVSMTAVVIFGIAPVARLSRVKAASFARTGASTHAERLGRGLGLSQGLVVGQVAASLVLLVAAGLLLQSLRNITRIESGFEPEQLLVARLDPAGSGLSPPELAPIYRTLRERIETLPGVQSASLSMYGKFNGATWIVPLDIRGEEISREDARTAIDVVDGAFFHTLGIPVLRGRGFSERDGAGAERVAVVNEQFVRTFFPDGAALGERFEWGDSDTDQPADVTIVGIVADVKVHDLREKPMPVVYFPVQQQHQPMESLEVRATGDAARLVSPVREVVRAVAPGLPVLEVIPMKEQMQRAVKHEELIGRLTAVFAIVCALLTAVGLYGLLGYVVSLQTKEIGLRMALGATSSRVYRMFVGKGLRLLVLGIAVGLAASIAATRMVESFIYGLAGLDPATLVGASVSLALVAWVAIGVPARRASRCNPVTALRWE